MEEEAPAPTRRTCRALYGLANALAGAVLILEILDPARLLGPIFGCLALALVRVAVAGFLRGR